MRVCVGLSSTDIAIVKAWGEFQKSIGKDLGDFSVRDYVRDRLSLSLLDIIEELRCELETKGVEWRRGYTCIPDWHRRNM